MSTERFNYSDNTITSIAVDSTNKRVWLAHQQNSDGVCVLRCVGLFDPSVEYFTCDIEVSAIVKVIIVGNWVYLIVEDATDFLYLLYVTSPNSYRYVVSIPAGETEYPIDIIADNNYCYVLVPGSASGQNAKIYKYDLTTGTYVETIDLSVSGDSVTNAVSMTFYDPDIWILTSEYDSYLVRVYNDGVWNYEKTLIE